MSTDGMALVARVIERAVEKFGQLQTGIVPETTTSGSPDDMLVDALAGQLLGFVGVGGSQATTPQPSGTDLTLLFDQLHARNLRAARAVGACDCWGDQATCPRCQGHGSPGWQLPERSSFDAIVRPALNRVSAHRVGAANGRVRSF